MTQLDRAAVAWGARSRDWAYLAESWLRPAYDRVLDHTAVGEGTRLVDIACGSGLAAMAAAQRGAQVSGLDAAEPLLRIARARVPDGDFRAGDMNALPFDDGSFDVVTSFNGIWHGWDQALSEARRVALPAAFVALTFWAAPSEWATGRGSRRWQRTRRRKTRTRSRTTRSSESRASPRRCSPAPASPSS